MDIQMYKTYTCIFHTPINMVTGTQEKSERNVDLTSFTDQFIWIRGEMNEIHRNAVCYKWPRHCHLSAILPFQLPSSLSWHTHKNKLFHFLFCGDMHYERFEFSNQKTNKNQNQRKTQLKSLEIAIEIRIFNFQFEKTRINSIFLTNFQMYF